MGEKQEVKFGIFWNCHECEKEFEHKEFLAHIKDFHKIKEAKGTQQAIQHMDGKDFYIWIYAVEIDGKKFTKTITNKRSGEDAAYWE